MVTLRYLYLRILIVTVSAFSALRDLRGARHDGERPQPSRPRAALHAAELVEGHLEKHG